jgi:hypothetical protein
MRTKRAHTTTAALLGSRENGRMYLSARDLTRCGDKRGRQWCCCIICTSRATTIQRKQALSKIVRALKKIVAPAWLTCLALHRDGTDTSFRHLNHDHAMPTNGTLGATADSSPGSAGCDHCVIPQATYSWYDSLNRCTDTTEFARPPNSTFATDAVTALNVAAPSQTVTRT